jgi:hypothetical protein
MCNGHAGGRAVATDARAGEIRILSTQATAARRRGRRSRPGK